MTSKEMAENMVQLKPDNKAQGKSFIRQWAPLIILASLIAMAWSLGLQEYISIENIAANRDWLISYVADNWLFSATIYSALYIVVVALSLPGAALLTIFGGFLFGWLIGGTLTVVAATIGAILIYEIVRTSIGELMAKKAGPMMNKFSKGFEDDAFSYLLFLRLVPVFPFWLVNIAPALLKVKRFVYIITTILGIIPGTYAISSLGSGFDSIIVKQRMAYDHCVAAKGADNCVFSVDISSLITPQLLGALCALGVVALIPIVLKRFRSSK